MSKYGTIPASPSTPLPEASSTALDSTSCVKAPGASAAAARRRRPWRELADPRALSVPRGLTTDAYRRARANLAHFAANYEVVFLAVVSVSLLWRPVCVLIGLCYIITPPAKVVSRVLLVLSFFLMVLAEPTASVLVSMPVGLLLVAVHAVLHRPADGVDEEAGRCECDTPPPSTN